MTYAQDVTARLLDTDGTTVISGDPLENYASITFNDEIDGPGTGTLVLPLSEAGATELTPGRFIDVQVDSTSRFTMIIEGDPQFRVLGEGEEAEAVVVVGGRGWGAMLDQAIVYPEVDLDLNLDTSWRVFSFASPSFPNAGAWAAAEELYEYLDGVTEGLRYQRASDGLDYPSPISFPVPTSPNFYDPSSPPGADYVDVYWIWPTGEDTSFGYAFFRRTLTITDANVYTFAITGDNFFTLFLEGVPILGENEDHFIWTGWKDATVALEAGTYQIGVVVQNIDIGIGPNPAGLIMTVHTVDGTQLPDEAILVTDANWVTTFDADIWPGWTPGQIFTDLLSEATTRGALAAYNSSTFAALTDTASNAWADVQDSSQYIPAFAAEVGRTIMAALDKAVVEGHIRWHMQPGTADLDIWAPSSLGTSSGVSLQEGVNLRSLERGSTAVYANSLLVQWEGGYVEVSDAAEITRVGTAIEDVFASEASTAAEATRQGEVELANRIASGWPAIVVEVEPTSSADAPYEGYELGETVEIPAIGGGTDDVEVLAIRMATDGLGRAMWSSELNRRIRSEQREAIDLLRQIGGRSGQPSGVVR